MLRLNAGTAALSCGTYLDCWEREGGVAHAKRCEEFVLGIVRVQIHRDGGVVMIGCMPAAGLVWVRLPEFVVQAYIAKLVT